MNSAKFASMSILLSGNKSNKAIVMNQAERHDGNEWLLKGYSFSIVGRKHSDFFPT